MYMEADDISTMWDSNVTKTDEMRTDIYAVLKLSTLENIITNMSNTYWDSEYNINDINRSVRMFLKRMSQRTSCRVVRMTDSDFAETHHTDKLR